DGIRYKLVTGVQTCALPISTAACHPSGQPSPARDRPSRTVAAPVGTRGLARFHQKLRVLDPTSAALPQAEGEPAEAAIRGAGTRSEERRVGKVRNVWMWES